MEQQIDELYELLAALKEHKLDIETSGRYAMFDEGNQETVAGLNRQIDQVESAIKRLMGGE